MEVDVGGARSVAGMGERGGERCRGWSQTSNAAPCARPSCWLGHRRR